MGKEKAERRFRKEPVGTVTEEGGKNEGREKSAEKKV